MNTLRAKLILLLVYIMIHVSWSIVILIDNPKLGIAFLIGVIIFVDMAVNNYKQLKQINHEQKKKTINSKGGRKCNILRPQ